jgi:hypothetical protein
MVQRLPLEHVNGLHSLYTLMKKVCPETSPIYVMKSVNPETSLTPRTLHIVPIYVIKMFVQRLLYSMYMASAAYIREENGRSRDFT